MLNTKNILYRLSPLLLLIFIDSFSFFVVIPVLLKIFYHNHYDLLPATTSVAMRNTLTGMTISLSMFAALIAAPFVGAASDRYGRKKTLLWCIVCVACGFLLPIIGIAEKNIYFIFIGRIISGIGSASQPVAQAVVADVCERENKAFFLGSIALMMTLALILGPLAGGYLLDAHVVSWFNSKTPFEFALVLSIINLFLILFLGLELGWSQYYQAIPLFLHLQLHFSVEKISLFSATMGVVMVVGLLIVYPLLLRVFSVKNIMRYTIFFVLIGLAACALFPFEETQWIFSALIALCTGMAYVSIVTLISNKVSDDAQGMTMGYLSALLYFAWMFTAFLSGLLVSLHTTLPLYVAALFLLVAFIKKIQR